LRAYYKRIVDLWYLRLITFQCDPVRSGRFRRRSHPDSKRTNTPGPGLVCPAGV